MAAQRAAPEHGGIRFKETAMLNLLNILPWPKPRAARRRGVQKSALATLLIAPPAADDERPLGCGWFDSSHELERGLQVREADAQCLSALPLSDWLDLDLRSWCGVPQQG